MDKTKSEIDQHQHISTLTEENEFFSLIEQRYQDMGYEILETCGPAPQENFYEFSKKQVHRDKKLSIQRETLSGLELVFV